MVSLGPDCAVALRLFLSDYVDVLVQVAVEESRLDVHLVDVTALQLSTVRGSTNVQFYP